MRSVLSGLLAACVLVIAMLVLDRHALAQTPPNASKREVLRSGSQPARQGSPPNFTGRVGRLSEAVRFQRGNPGFRANSSVPEVRRAMGLAIAP